MKNCHLKTAFIAPIAMETLFGKNVFFLENSERPTEVPEFA